MFATPIKGIISSRKRALIKSGYRQFRRMYFLCLGSLPYIPLHFLDTAQVYLTLGDWFPNIGWHSEDPRNIHLLQYRQDLQYYRILAAERKWPGNRNPKTLSFLPLIHMRIRPRRPARSTCSLIADWRESSPRKFGWKRGTSATPLPKEVVLFFAKNLILFRKPERPKRINGLYGKSFPRPHCGAICNEIGGAAIICANIHAIIRQEREVAICPDPRL